MKDKQYIVRKYVMAKDIKDAIRKEKHAPVLDAWIDDDWKKENPLVAESKIGFKKL